MISIRIAEKRDLLQLQHLARKIYQETFSEVNTPENMEKYLTKSLSLNQIQCEFDEPGSIFYLAVKEHTFVGHAKLRVNDEVADQLGLNSIEMQRLYVDTPFQHKKVGALLMQSCLDYAENKKFDWIWLGVWEKNIKAQQFYTRWGFEKFNDHIFMMGDD